VIGFELCDHLEWLLFPGTVVSPSSCPPPGGGGKGGRKFQLTTLLSFALVDESFEFSVSRDEGAEVFLIHCICINSWRVHVLLLMVFKLGDIGTVFIFPPSSA